MVYSIEVPEERSKINVDGMEYDARKSYTVVGFKAIDKKTGKELSHKSFIPDTISKPLTSNLITYTIENLMKSTLLRFWFRRVKEVDTLIMIDVTVDFNRKTVIIDPMKNDDEDIRISSIDLEVD
jgi:hypothetical protein